MMHRQMAHELKWTLCRDFDGDPETAQFETYGKAMDYLARRGMRCLGRDTAARVVYYAASED